MTCAVKRRCVGGHQSSAPDALVELLRAAVRGDALLAQWPARLAHLLRPEVEAVGLRPPPAPLLLQRRLLQALGAGAAGEALDPRPLPAQVGAPLRKEPREVPAEEGHVLRGLGEVQRRAALRLLLAVSAHTYMHRCKPFGTRDSAITRARAPMWGSSTPHSRRSHVSRDCQQDYVVSTGIPLPSRCIARACRTPAITQQHALQCVRT